MPLEKGSGVDYGGHTDGVIKTARQLFMRSGMDIRINCGNKTGSSLDACKVQGIANRHHMKSNNYDGHRGHHFYMTRIIKEWHSVKIRQRM